MLCPVLPWKTDTGKIKVCFLFFLRRDGISLIAVTMGLILTARILKHLLPFTDLGIKSRTTVDKRLVDIVIKCMVPNPKET